MVQRIIIAGAGRSGTTMLVRLLTRLGYDTGFDGDETYIPAKRAGMEITAGRTFEGTLEDLREQYSRLPRIIKSPEYSFYLKMLLSGNIVPIGHIIIPIRESVEAAKSRLEVGLDWLCKDKNVQHQAVIHAAAVGACVECCVLYDVPYTTMRFPDLVKDWRYCRDKLAEALPDIKRKRGFRKAFEEIN